MDAALLNQLYKGRNSNINKGCDLLSIGKTEVSSRNHALVVYIMYLTTANANSTLLAPPAVIQALIEQFKVVKLSQRVLSPGASILYLVFVYTSRLSIT